MINIIRQWCEGIVVAIVLSVIIELLVPEGNNKKYVKVVIGVYIVFVVINPLLKLMNYDFSLKSFYDNTEKNNYSNVNTEIKDVYILGIEEELKKQIENLGYIVNDLKINVDNNYENINSIKMNIEKKENENVIKPINIGNDEEDINYNDVIEYIKENYILEDSQIIIN